MRTLRSSSLPLLLLAAASTSACAKPATAPEPAVNGHAAAQADAPAPAPANAEAHDAATAAPAGLPDRDPALAKKLVDEGAVLLDVRSQGEWDEGHLEKATLIPVDQLAGRIAELETATGGDKTKPIVVYCRSGRRADGAKQMLLKAGYTQVTNLGGMTDWPAE